MSKQSDVFAVLLKHKLCWRCHDSEFPVVPWPYTTVHPTCFLVYTYSDGRERDVENYIINALDEILS